MRAIWKGHIQFSLVTIPIEVYSAVDNKSVIKFKQLHKDDHGPVGYDKVCRSCNKKVPYGDIVKGFEYQPDQFVVLEKEDFDAIKLKSSRIIEVDSFVDINEVHPSRFEAVYFIGPNGEVALKTYSLFCQTLKKSGKAGVGRLILRDREDVVLLTAHKNGMVMYKLRYPHELKSIEDIPDLGVSEPDEKQLKLAETLVESLTTTFAEIDFEDRYRDALMEMVEQKVAGKEVVALSTEEEKPVVDIMDALKASIEEAKKIKKGA